MAFLFNRAGKEIQDDTIELSTDTLKMGLATSTFTPNRDDDFLDLSTGSDFESGELNVTGYTRAFGGAGRKTLASKTFTEDDTNDRAKFSSASPSWTALATGQTIAGGLILKEITNDAASRPISWNDLASGIPTNGADFTLNCPSNGWWYTQH